LVELRAGALVIAPDVFFTTRSKQLAALTLGHALPSIYLFREFAAAGGLMSYGTSNADAYRQLGVYTGRILSVHSSAVSDFLAPIAESNRSVVARSAPMPFSSCPTERNRLTARGSVSI
jgi:hypothetical protein